MRNLLVQLRAQGAERVRQIADCWGVPLAGRGEADHVAQLYRTLRDPWAVRDRVEALGTVPWAIIEAILSTTGDAGQPQDALPALLGVPRGAVEAAVAHLAGCGILTPEDGAPLSLPRELTTAFRRVQEERLTGPTLGPETPLRALLTTLEGGEWEEAAAAWGLRITPGTIGREALTDEILARVDLPEQRRAVARELPPDAAKVFAALRAAGGRITLADIRAQCQLEPPALREAARALNRRLLAWPVWGDGDAEGGGRALIVPRDVLAPRRPPRDAPPPLAPLAATPSERPTHPYSAAWDLLTIVQRLGQRALEWREGDEERNATALRRLAPALWGTGDEGRVRPGYVPFLLALARDEGLVRVEEERAEIDEPAVERWRNRPFPEQSRALFDRWRAAPDWPEGLSQDDLQLATVDWPAAREALLDELRACAVGAWYDLATLALRIARLRPGLLGGSFSAARASGPAGTREEVTVAAVTVALLGALAPLGALAEGSAGSGKSRHPAVSLTPLGAWLLGRGPVPEQPPIGDRPLALGADFEILLFQPTPRRLWALGAVAELVRLDTASIYRLTEGSVARGVAAGLTLEQIVALLERGGRAALPQNVAFTLREWTRGHAGIRLGHALILRPDNPDDADRLRATLARAQLPAPEALSNGRLLLTLPDEGDTGAIVEALRGAGFTVHLRR